MCDTIVAPQASTAENVMLFGKNSDRQRNEAQTVEYFPRADHAAGTSLTCTYVTIPQARRTHAVLLCRPFWIWGAEMGANDHGVVVGNEGLHARSPAPESNALTGMDLVRLALERAETAAGAAHVITTLLSEHGQGGNCGYITFDFYNNGFLIADPTEAFVLETVGQEWLIERVRGVRAMSNVYSIGRDADRVSTGLWRLIRESGWSDDESPDCAAVISNPHREHIGHAGARRTRSTSLLCSREGHLGARDLMRILRDHGDSSRSCDDWHPEQGGPISLCMHAGAEDRSGQTVGSLVSELHAADAVHWVTGTAAPCTSIFKPLLIGVPVPAYGPLPVGRYDSRTTWWRHERIHRAALLGDFGRIVHEIHQEREVLEASFETRAKSVLDGGTLAERSHVVEECWMEASHMEKRWLLRMGGGGSREATPYRATWLQMNQIAGFEP